MPERDWTVKLIRGKIERYKELEGKKTIVVIFLHEIPVVFESGIFY